MCWLLLRISLFCVFILLSSQNLSAEDLNAALNNLIREQGTAKTGISVVYAASGDSIYQHREDLPLKPASVQKILTSLVALQKLGVNYRFKTGFYVDTLSKGVAGNLYIKGGGDPDLRTEKLWILAKRLKRTGIKSVQNLYLDTSLFPVTRERQGQRAYEAGSSALSFNFNSILFEICPKLYQTSARINVEPEEWAPVVTGKILVTSRGADKFNIDEINGKGKSSYRVKGVIRARDDCASVYRSVSDPPRYLGTVLKAYLKLLGVRVTGIVAEGTVPSQARLLFEHSSRALDQIVEDLNRFSNNFIAGQIVSALGTTPENAMDHRLGLKVLEQYLLEQGFASEEFTVSDGSGLSHSNRLSARILTSLLTRALHLPEIRPEFEKSLSVAGINGTLRKRNFDPEGLFIRGKTGTLNGVRSLAGYFYSRRGRIIAFSIIQNRSGSKYPSAVLEKKLLFTLFNADI